MRILVVEDEKKVANFIKRGLEEEQYEVRTATQKRGRLQRGKKIMTPMHAHEKRNCPDCGTDGLTQISERPTRWRGILWRCSL